MRDQDFMLRLRAALQATRRPDTAYLAVADPANPALGQCYPTARVVQHYHPQTEILKGVVRLGDREDVHFWNGLAVGADWYHIDLSWRQFPTGTSVSAFVVLDRHDLSDSAATQQRYAVLLQRVAQRLGDVGPG